MQSDFGNAVILGSNDKLMLCLILENQINCLWLNVQQNSLLTVSGSRLQAERDTSLTYHYAESTFF